jgi:hypothetical protein
MRIAIVTLPRTGGTNFAVWLCRELGYKSINEPYWSNHHRERKYTPYEMWEQPNTVTKWIFDEFEHMEGDINTYLASYDFVILHTRVNVYEECRSFLYAAKTFLSHQWHMKYAIPSGWEDEHKDEINEYVDKFSANQSKINALNGDIKTTYEGIYYENDSQKLIDILKFTPKYLNMLDSRCKYLVDSKTHKTLI